MIIEYYAENTKDPTQCEGQSPDTLKYYARSHFYDISGCTTRQARGCVIAPQAQNRCFPAESTKRKQDERQNLDHFGRNCMSNTLLDSTNYVEREILAIHPRQSTPQNRV